MRKFKNLWHIVAVLTIVAMILVGCKSAATEVVEPTDAPPAEVEPTDVLPAEVEPTDAPPAEPVDIKVWTWTWEPENNYVSGVVDEFNAANPDINVTYEHFPPFGEGAYADRLRLSYAEESTADVFFIRNFEIGVFVDKGMVRLMDDAAIEAMGFSSMSDLQELYLPGALEGWQYDGKFYGLPNEISVFVFYANTDHLEEAGYDPDTVNLETWEDVIEVSKDLGVIDADGNVTRIGQRFGWIAPQYSLHNLTLFFAQMGGSILNQAGTECTLNQPESVEAVEYFIWLNLESGLSDPNFGTQEGGAFQLDWAAELSSFLATNPAAVIGYANEESAVAGHWRAYPLPYPEDGHPGNVAWGWAWVVSSTSEHPEEAWKLVQALTADAAKALEISGFPQGTKGLLDSDALAALPAYAEYESSMEGMKFAAGHPDHDEILEVLAANMQSIIFAGVDVQTALDQACSEIDAIIQR